MTLGDRVAILATYIIEARVESPWYFMKARGTIIRGPTIYGVFGVRWDDPDFPYQSWLSVNLIQADKVHLEVLP